MVVQYQVEISASMSAAIGSQIFVVNGGTSSVSLDDLTVRYYLTNEVSASLSKTINWANVGPVGGASSGFSTGNITIAVVPMTTPVPMADTYVELGFTGNQTLPAGYRVQLSWAVQDFSSQNFNQTNDYSYNAADTTATNWQNVVLLYQGQSVVWGTVP
jgi:hypothetical protein